MPCDAAWSLQVYIALKLQPWIAIIVFVTLRWAAGRDGPVGRASSGGSGRIPAARTCSSSSSSRSQRLHRPHVAPPRPRPRSGYIPMTIYLTEWRGKYRR